MIKRLQEMETDIKENMRGGKGEVSIQTIFTPDEYKGKARLIAKVKLNPGCSVGMHEHINEEEIYYVIQGEGVLTDSTCDEEITMKTGDASLTLGGQSHAIRNDSDKILEFVAIVMLY